MNRNTKLIVAMALPLLGAAACSDFLTGGELDNDPNRPTQATLTQRFISSQSNVWAQQTGEIARTTCMWLQQCAGTDRQYVSTGTYVIKETDFDGSMLNTYVGGGLVDLRLIQKEALAAGDKKFAGIAQVLEALLVGTAADIWGALPYSEAVTAAATPKFDSQLTIYASIQTLLDEAIANIAGGGAGPGGADLSYLGDEAKWTELANTLKARFYMHTAEKTGASVYPLVVAAATKGISTSANDYRSSHRDAPGEKNLWFQFMEEQRAGYLSAGSYLVDLLKARNDPRLAQYYSRAQGESPGCVQDVDYCGAPPNTTLPGTYSVLSATRGSESFAQPIVTYAENTLLWAEALALGAGTDAAALAKLNEYKTSVGVPTVSLSGAALLTEIRTEKYIALFQSIEVWNDYKRTCFPNVPPGLPNKKIPARFYYGTTERQTNPNTPDVNAQDASPRNENDPASPAGCLAS